MLQCYSVVCHVCKESLWRMICLLFLAVAMGCGDGITLSQKILFPSERLSLKWTQVHRIGAGLQNLGNTCYLNSALQCLSYTAPLANYMLSREHSKTCRSSHILPHNLLKFLMYLEYHGSNCCCVFPQRSWAWILHAVYDAESHHPGFC